jgi:hypothetical protein
VWILGQHNAQNQVLVAAAVKDFEDGELTSVWWLVMNSLLRTLAASVAVLKLKKEIEPRITRI